MMLRPEENEYDPYYGLYIGKVPEGDVLTLMETELEALVALLGDLPTERETYRYEAGKWSIRELLGHLIDSERVFAYRALCFARGDAGPLPGMEQDDWALASNAHDRPLAELLAEFSHLRRGNRAMFAGFDDEAGLRSGIASGCSFTVRALAYIIVGHAIHHRGVLRERYLAD